MRELNGRDGAGSHGAARRRAIYGCGSHAGLKARCSVTWRNTAREVGTEYGVPPHRGACKYRSHKYRTHRAEDPALSVVDCCDPGHPGHPGLCLPSAKPTRSRSHQTRLPVEPSWRQQKRVGQRPQRLVTGQRPPGTQSPARFFSRPFRPL